VPQSTRPPETKSRVATRSATRAGGGVSRRHQDDAMSKADAPRTLGRGGEEHLRSRRMRVFLEEVVLHLPGIVNAQAVRQLDLIPGRAGRGGAQRRAPRDAAAGAHRRSRISWSLLHRAPPYMGGTPKRLRNIARRCPTSDQSRPPIRPPSTRGKISDLTAASPMPR